MRQLQLLGVLTATALLTSCGGGLGGMGSGLPGGGAGLSADCAGDFGANDAAMKLEAFIAATDNFVGTAHEITATLTDTCIAMGEELGIPRSEMQGPSDVPAARAACDPVAAKIRAELNDLRVSANLQITVIATPPVCEASLDAYGGCMAECEVDYDPGQVELECEGGELRGGCEGECTGSCSVEASGQCSGSCEGTCSGGCSGTCQGACDGECSSTGADGQCNGTCSGTCSGSCSAGCSGSCSGQCVVEASAQCSGECRGSCSVEFTEPRCTGTVRPPSASAECSASCDARLEAEVQCRPGQLVIDIQGEVAENVSERVGRLRNALESGLANILTLKAKLERLGRSGRLMAETFADVPDAMASVGANGIRCAGQAIAAIPPATVEVSVSIEVSASVSGSVGG